MRQIKLTYNQPNVTVTVVNEDLTTQQLVIPMELVESLAHDNFAALLPLVNILPFYGIDPLTDEEYDWLVESMDKENETV